MADAHTHTDSETCDVTAMTRVQSWEWRIEVTMTGPGLGSQVLSESSTLALGHLPLVYKSSPRPGFDHWSVDMKVCECCPLPTNCTT